MNQTSSIATGSATITAATLVPIVTWAVGGFSQPIPETVPYLIAAAIVTAAHLVVNLVNKRLITTVNSDETQTEKVKS